MLGQILVVILSIMVVVFAFVTPDDVPKQYPIGYSCALTAAMLVNLR